MLMISPQNHIAPNSQSPKVNYKNISFSGIKPRPPKLSGLNSDAQARLEQFNKKYEFIHKKKTQMAVKRGIDILFGSVGVILSAPILLVAAVAIKLESKGSALFKQQRIGKDGKLFTIYKLRTMAKDSDIKSGLKNNDIFVQSAKDVRITKVGKTLRKFSIDELPQFLNIVKGDMSLVGPRPCPLNFEAVYENFDPKFVRRYTVKPGAQMKYPFLKDEDVHLKVKAEKNYLDNWSLLEDVKQIGHTFKQVLTGRNY